MEFFKLTREKIILSILILLSFVLFFAFHFFFGSDFYGICPPMLGSTFSQAPLSLHDTITNMYIIATQGNYNYDLRCGPDSRSMELANSIITISRYILIILIPYFLSCVIIFFANKCKRKKRYNVKKFAN